MKVSALFRKIEELQGEDPWGHFLDAGTGPNSISWVSQLQTDRWTAVTAQRVMAEETAKSLSSPPRPSDRLIFGNWKDDSFLAGERFDTVLLDHFIGAIDAFAPYQQESLIEKLAGLTDKRLYITGMEPYVPITADDEVGLYIGDLGRFRDACMLLTRDRPYREFPADWIVAQLERIGMKNIETKFFKVKRGASFVKSQLEICAERISRLDDQELASSLTNKVEQMRNRGNELIEHHGGLPYGRDYVLWAEV